MAQKGIPLFQVDAFSGQPFAGNPAAVCLLESERDQAWMQAVAAEMNLSETAFVRKRDDGFDLRWFTPLAEVDLCGHATQLIEKRPVAVDSRLDTDSSSESCHLLLREQRNPLRKLLYEGGRYLCAHSCPSPSVPFVSSEWGCPTCRTLL